MTAGPRPSTGAARLNVAGLLAEAPGADRDYEIDGVDVDLGDDLAPGRARRRARSGSPARTAACSSTADLTTALAGECSRCLRADRDRRSSRIEEEVLPVDRHRDRRAGRRSRTATSPRSPRLTDHHELDLEPLVARGDQLAEPIAPLCRAGLPGPVPRLRRAPRAPGHDHPTTTTSTRGSRRSGPSGSTTADESG